MLVALIVLILLVILFGGGGMLAASLNFLWWILIIGLMLWIVGFFFRAAEGGGRSLARARSRLAPRKRRAEAALEGGRDLAPVRMPLQLRLAEHELPVEGDLEAPGVTAAQLDCAQDGRPAGQQLVGQAHGLVEIVSRDAELDRCFVFGVDHANGCYPAALLRIPN